MPTVAARTARLACALALAVLAVAATLTALAGGPAQLPPGPRAGRAAGPGARPGAQPGRYRRGPGGAARTPAAASLLGWAARHGLRATWFRGQPTALLAARPAVLGRALGVRIDDFRLPGYRVFYASRGGGHVPAPLNAEVATVGRITSFGQVQSVGDPSGPATGGLAPGGFLNAYDVRPLWQHGDLGQGETIVFFEVDGYHPADLATYAARFGLPSVRRPTAAHRPAEREGARGKRHGHRGGPRDRARRHPGLREPGRLRGQELLPRGAVPAGLLDRGPGISGGHLEREPWPV